MALMVDSKNHIWRNKSNSWKDNSIEDNGRKHLKQESKENQSYPENVQANKSLSETKSISEENKDELALPIFFKLDEKLHLSNEEFKIIISFDLEIQRIRSTSELLKFESLKFPKISQMKFFSLMAFVQRDVNQNHKGYEKSLRLPKGWKLLTRATNNTGYSGMAYWNSSRRQVIIAHQIYQDEFWTSINISAEGYLPHISSACSFTHIVLKALEELKPNCKGGFQLFFTGHHLGGMLAQVTTFLVEFVNHGNIRTVFNIDHNVEEYHARTEVFDSPGCEEVLQKIAENYKISPEKPIDFGVLDIKNYVQGTNLVNCCHKHVGILIEYHESGKSEMKEIDKKTWPLIHTPSFKKIENETSMSNRILFFFLKLFLVRIVLWLYNSLRLLKSHLVSHKYDTNSHNRNECRVNVFKKSEYEKIVKLKSLEKYRKYWKSEFPILPHLSDNLNKIDIVDKNVIKFQSEQDLLELVPFVKRMLRINTKMVQKCLIENESLDYCETQKDEKLIPFFQGDTDLQEEFCRKLTIKFHTVLSYSYSRSNLTIRITEKFPINQNKFAAEIFIEALTNDNLSKQPIILDTLMREVLLLERFRLVRSDMNERLIHLRHRESVYNRFGSILASAWKDTKNWDLWQLEHSRETALQICIKENLDEITKLFIGAALKNDDTAKILLPFLTRRYVESNNRTKMVTVILSSERLQLTNFFVEQLKKRSESIQKQYLLSNIFCPDFDEVLLDLLVKDPDIGSIVRDINEDKWFTEKMIIAGAMGNVEDLQRILDNARDEETRHYLTLSYSMRDNFASPLNMAVAVGHVQATHFLLETTQPEVLKILYNYPYRSLLHDAVKYGDYQVIKLVASKMEYNISMTRDWTAITDAIRSENDQIVSCLLESGFQMDTKNEDGESLLHYVAKYGKPELLRYFVEKGLGINTLDSSLNTPLHSALKSGNTETSLWLLNNGANVIVADNTGNTPLHIAATNCNVNLDVVDKLLEMKPDLQAKNDDELTPFYLAFKKKNMTMIKKLLPSQSESNQKYFWKLAISTKLPRLSFQCEEKPPVSITDNEKEVSANFYAADYIFKNFDNQVILEKFLSLTNVWLEDKYQDIRWYLNQFFKSHVFDERVLKQFASITINMWSTYRKKLLNEKNESVWHVLVKERLEFVLKFYVNSFLFQSENKELKRFMLHEDNEGQTAFQILVKDRNEEMINVVFKCLEKYSGENRKSIVTSIFDAQVVNYENMTFVINIIEQYMSLKPFCKQQRSRLSRLQEFLKATQNGDLKTLKTLYKSAEDDKYRYFLLFAAKETNDFKNIIEGKSYYRALNLAIIKGKIECTEFLLKKEGELGDFQSKKLLPKFVPPMFNAIKSNKLSIIKLLVNNLEPNQEDNWKALKLGLFYERRNILEYILSLEIFDFKGYDKTGTLLMAAKMGFNKMINFLLQNGGFINETDWCKRTPLHLAIEFDRQETIKTLVINGADINAKDLQGNTPLHYAGTFGNAKAREILLEHNADVQILNNRGEKPKDIEKKIL